MKIKQIALASLISLLSVSTVEAGYTFKDGWFVDAAKVAYLSCDEHWNRGMQAYENCRFREATEHFVIIVNSFPNSAVGQDGYYYLGVCYMNQCEYDFANDALTQYLKCKSNPLFFLEAIECKFQIAECFKDGHRRRLFGTKQLPKWADGTKLALTIYDEVIAAMPCHDLAARALFSKAQLNWMNKEYRESIEAFQTVIKRFPKNELAPECYLQITRVYLDQCQNEFQNPDLLAFAQINVRRFTQDFPREERLSLAEEDVMRIKEIYANGLYETGQFYERTNQRHAAVIYYGNTIMQFPDTWVSDRCRDRLMCLGVDSSRFEKKTEVDPQSLSQASEAVEQAPTPS